MSIHFKLSIALLLAVCPSIAHAAPPTLVGPRVTLLRPEGAVTPGEQLRTIEAPALAVEADGGFLVAWIELNGSSGRRAVLRPVDQTGAIGAGRKLFSQNDSPQGSLYQLQIHPFEGRVIATAAVFENHVGSWIGSWEVRDDGEVIEDRVTGNSLARCFTVTARNEFEFTFLWQDQAFNFSQEAPLASSFVTSYRPSLGRWLAPGRRGQVPIASGSNISQLPCPAGEGGAIAWWTFERPATPRLHFTASLTTPVQHLPAGLRAPILVAETARSAATGRNYLVVARKPAGLGLRVFRFAEQSSQLQLVGDTSVGDRVLAVDDQGKLVVAQPTAGGSQVLFLNDSLTPEGPPLFVPSTLVSAEFNDLGEVLVTWVRDPVFRPGGGSVSLVAGQLLRWP